MKRFTILIFSLFLTYSLIAQEKFLTTTGVINFEASVPLFQEIKAVNRNVAVTFDTKSRQFSCAVLIKDFDFELDLMQQHFNDNYMESHRYPKAVFKGRIAYFDKEGIKNSTKDFIVKGKLYIRGKAREIELKVAMRETAEGIFITSSLPITISDFDIYIPEKVAAKIAKTANTELSAIIRTNNPAYITYK